MWVPAPSGRQVLLAHGDQRAVVVEVGGGLRTYEVGGTPVLDGYGEDERCDASRGQPLLPWPNRVDGGLYELDGQTMALALSEPERGNAIHGLTRWCSWEVLQASTARALLGHVLRPQQGWAWTLELRIDYRLGDTGLDVSLQARNRSASRAPFGAGFHPYLAAPTGRVDDLEVLVPAATRYVADERGLPVGTESVAGTELDLRAPTLLGDRRIDTAFTDLGRDAQGEAVVEVSDPRSGGSVQVRLGPAWTHVMVFTGDTIGERARRGLAVEPMSCPANALRSGVGLVLLEPDEIWEGTWSITPGWL
ncbi:MAG: aldose 1-epimerase family protein [Actinomycetota bacterium]|nr:aldose 1-epimerase family protein [Actinomycetota bacterium]